MLELQCWTVFHDPTKAPIPVRWNIMLESAMEGLVVLILGNRRARIQSKPDWHE